MISKQMFYKTCPKTRAEFVKLFKTDYVFRSHAKDFGFEVIGESVIFPNGKIANSHIK